jgi:hypothetical protein
MEKAHSTILGSHSFRWMSLHPFEKIGEMEEHQYAYEGSDMLTARNHDGSVDFTYDLFCRHFIYIVVVYPIFSEDQ